MGFALPRLQDKYGPIMASVVLVVLWALWHLPAYFNSTQVVADKVGLGELDRLLYLVPLLMLLAISTRVVMSVRAREPRGDRKSAHGTREIGSAAPCAGSQGGL